MKKPLTLIVLIALTPALSCLAQDNDVNLPQDTAITFSEVVNAKGVSQADLYIRARDWLNYNTVGLRIQDGRNGELSARGTVIGTATFRFLGSHRLPASFAFIINVWVKDGRYEYQVTNVYNTTINGTAVNGVLGELFTTTQWPVDLPGYGHNKTNEAYQTAKDSFRSIEVVMVSSLKAAMTQPSTPNF
jgi:Domain of unknown function (DUF4468) with TBP-like fold